MSPRPDGQKTVDETQQACMGLARPIPRRKPQDVVWTVSTGGTSSPQIAEEARNTNGPPRRAVGVTPWTTR